MTGVLAMACRTVRGVHDREFGRDWPESDTSGLRDMQSGGGMALEAGRVHARECSAGQLAPACGAGWRGRGAGEGSEFEKDVVGI
jgi:hypothetical protein